MTKVLRLQEKPRSGEVVGREALAQEGGAERLALGGVPFHQAFKLAGEVGQAQAEVPGKLAIGDGFARRREGGEPFLKRVTQNRGPGRPRGRRRRLPRRWPR